MKRPKFLSGQVVEFDLPDSDIIKMFKGNRFFGVIKESMELLGIDELNYKIEGNGFVWIIPESNVKTRYIDIESGNY